MGRQTPLSDLERRWYALPARHSGMGFENPVFEATFALQDSLELTQRLQDAIESQLKTDTSVRQEAVKMPEDLEESVLNGDLLDAKGVDSVPVDPRAHESKLH